MSPRNNINQFEKAIIQHGKVIDKQPIGRAALLKSISTLEITGKNALQSGDVTMGVFASRMQNALTPIETSDYTKPPLSAEHLASLSGKLGVYATIASVNEQEADTPGEPTDTSKLDTAKRKA